MDRGFTDTLRFTRAGSADSHTVDIVTRPGGCPGTSVTVVGHPPLPGLDGSVDGQLLDAFALPRNYGN